MVMQEIRDIARDNGIKPGRMSKIILVRTIQESEGNYVCFATAMSSECEQQGCLWRDDCLAADKKGLSS
ncbi:MAG: SAP domain-containing protein [Gammaproteobacteria bacterium]|nr:SAP domain-containing protein [Gammaproteobacteria bacterium]